MFNLFKNKNQPPLQSSAVLRIIGDRTSGKTTYMASLARWPNADPDSPVQAVTAVDEGGEDLINKAQNILEQGLQLEQTDLSKNVSEVKDCTLQITLKEKKLGAKLLNLNVSSKDYAGEFFTDLLHKVKDPLLDEYLEDCLQCNGILFLVDGSSRRKDLEYANGLDKLLLALDRNALGGTATSSEKGGGGDGGGAGPVGGVAGSPNTGGGAGGAGGFSPDGAGAFAGHKSGGSGIVIIRYAA